MAATDAEIIEAFHKGIPPRFIHKKLGCGMARSYRVLRRAGLMGDPRIIKNHRDAILRLYRSGKGYKTIAKELGISTTSIQRHLSKMGAIEPFERRPQDYQAKLPIEEKVRRAQEWWFKREQRLIKIRDLNHWHNHPVANSHWATKYMMAKYHSDASFKIKVNIMSRLRLILKNQGIQRTHKTKIKIESLVGCTIGQLRNHIESTFQGGMTWLNHGMWELDHIIPCASFDLSDEDQIKKCFHYTNLHALWMRPNRSKSNRLLAPSEIQKLRTAGRHAMVEKSLGGFQIAS